MIALLLLALPPVLDSHWDTILACPRVSSGTASGTGVVIGVKDGFAYVLTAGHVAPSDRLSVRFSTREKYPTAVRFHETITVVGRWADPDLALLRFPLGDRPLPVLALAPAWERPKTFPFAARSAGVGAGEASSAREEVVEAREFVKRAGRGGAFFWRTEAPTEQGRSGGPLLDSRRRVIGIAVAVRGGAGYYAHHDEILAALKRDGHRWLIPDK